MNIDKPKAPISRRNKFIFALKIIFYLLLIIVLIYWNDIYQDAAGKIDFSGYINRFINATLFFFTGHLVITTSRLILIGIYNRRHRTRRSENFVAGINQVSTVLTVFIFFLTILSLFDITLPQLFASVGFAAAAFAILFKDYISNMINGMILMFNDQVSIGDFVKIGNQKGHIVDIKLMNMHMVNEDEELVLIPNISFFNTEMINYSKQAIPKVIVEFQLAHTFGNKLEDLKNYLIQNLSEYQQYIIEDSYALKIIRLSKDQLDLKFQVVLHEDNDPIEKQIKRKVPFLIAEFINFKNDSQ